MRATRFVWVALAGLVLGQPAALWAWGSKPGHEHGGKTVEDSGKEHGGKDASGQKQGGQKPEQGGQQEHGGQEKSQSRLDLPAEHAAIEPAAEAAAEPTPPTPEQLRQTIRDHVQSQAEQNGGVFEILDPKTNATRQLQFVRVHKRVGKTGDYYYSCTDMLDLGTEELLDLDFDVEQQVDGSLMVVDERIHKVEGNPRYTYDEHDNLIPLPD